jgi:hypothetical protein
LAEHLVALADPPQLVAGAPDLLLGLVQVGDRFLDPRGEPVHGVADLEDLVFLPADLALDAIGPMLGLLELLARVGVAGGLGAGHHGHDQQRCQHGTRRASGGCRVPSHQVRLAPIAPQRGDRRPYQPRVRMRFPAAPGVPRVLSASARRC